MRGFVVADRRASGAARTPEPVPCTCPCPPSGRPGCPGPSRHLRAPHSRYAPAYQRRGLATAVYRWALDGGQCLMTGARQSPGAHALWDRLACEYLSGYVRVKDKALAYLGAEVPTEVLDDLHTRRFLLGRRWTLERLRAATGMG